MLVPKTLCLNFCKGSAKTHKWALIAWEKLMLPKVHGGLGIRDPLLINKAYAIKFWWLWVQGGN